MLFINLAGYVKSIPHHKGKINSILRKLAILEKFSTPPQYKPTPTNFQEQIIYPTSSVYKILQSLAGKAAQIKFSDILNEFKELTTDHEELDILISHLFDMAWTVHEFPFFSQSGKVFNFLNVKTSVFEPPYLDEKYQSLTINELSSSGWPYQPVVEILNSLFYIVNPIEGAKIFYDAMDKTANIVTESTEEEELVNFDTLFPLILISVLASGLVCEPIILEYVAMLATSNYPDSIVVFAASYVEAILAHLSSLDETGKPLPKPEEDEL
ncbi:hypothetical protein TVAG_030490 [Trichomonas vaginalis G3]|uniref:VPS9 domain-containing protein n=1 Tax=Trichomonas vaginalis (strain ATCC PRA-98 / G3) TaxID=412133 RepID=A2EY88_TRIV3|nr:hypothetical protein TVAGG3_0868470 [Trichomonas vaginalis G3]EAY02376.1 hypothetical protein TVAG_030490 [Trichomonas vaginalis G3]KAI5501202.1 hypothetical protein TVAGG3_0868470 [Trichomonas vaginalis G3]|eukprot:XP_001330637.1 hypothetical protein [Trichomonas vaginalis G3]